MAHTGRGHRNNISKILPLKVHDTLFWKYLRSDDVYRTKAGGLTNGKVKGVKVTVEHRPGAACRAIEFAIEGKSLIGLVVTFHRSAQ